MQKMRQCTGALAPLPRRHHAWDRRNRPKPTRAADICAPSRCGGESPPAGDKYAPRGKMYTETEPRTRPPGPTIAPQNSHGTTPMVCTRRGGTGAPVAPARKAACACGAQSSQKRLPERHGTGAPDRCRGARGPNGARSAHPTIGVFETANATSWRPHCPTLRSGHAARGGAAPGWAAMVGESTAQSAGGQFGRGKIVPLTTRHGANTPLCRGRVCGARWGHAGPRGAIASKNPVPN